ncbi:MAG: CDP-alcohol phosphatidyltransferase family protein [Aggregatilineales bacterium]
MTASEWVRIQTNGLTGRIGHAGQRLGLSPDAVTIAGALIVVGAAPLISFGAFVPAGLLLIIAALFDVLDGAIARAMKRRNRFGALLDSTLDRYADGLLLLGLMAYFAQRGEMVGLLIAGLALMGAYGVSYIRAKAESLGILCKDGLFSRFERTLVLIAALLTGWILPGVIILAIGSNLTAFQRVLAVYRATRADETS